MELSRRDFLKLSGAAAGGAAVLGMVPAGTAFAAPREITLKKRIGETTTICCYCGVGCGAIAAADANEVITIEGNPDHPINEGTLCSKGQALQQFHTVYGEDNNENPRRLKKPKYRKPGAADFEEVEWDWAIQKIAERMKATRDATWEATADVGGTTYTVNRTLGIASFGGGELDNEECYLLVKMLRALGMLYIEHCARI